jgi:hypothetical protein
MTNGFWPCFALRPCAARTRLFRPINTRNVALRAHLPVYRNFAALFTLYNCLSIKKKNPRKITVWGKIREPKKRRESKAILGC